VRALVIVLVVVVVAFLIGFFWPGRSRQLQEKVKDEATSARNRSRPPCGQAGRLDRYFHRQESMVD
jgi:hypothetical protein